MLLPWRSDESTVAVASRSSFSVCVFNWCSLLWASYMWSAPVWSSAACLSTELHTRLISLGQPKIPDNTHDFIVCTLNVSSLVEGGKYSGLTLNIHKETYLEFLPHLLLWVKSIIWLAWLIPFHKDPVPWQRTFWRIQRLHLSGLALTGKQTEIGGVGNLS